MFDFKTLVRPNIASLKPYRCARDDYKEGILLDANENSYGVALNSTSEREKALELERYPDPHQIELKQQIVDFRNSEANVQLKDGPKISPKNLCLGVGSDESIDMLMRCVCVPGKDKMLICPPTYGMYSICATVNDVALVKVPLTVPDFQVDSDKVLQTVVSDAAIKLIYITSPGNPTCKLVSVKDLLALVKAVREQWNGLVVVDEAYIDFTEVVDGHSQSMSTLVNQYDNLVVLQTLSKSFGLAGIRLGVTFSSEELASTLNAMKYPYNISSLTADVAMRSTSPEGIAKMKEHVQSLLKQRDVVLSELQKIAGVGKIIGGLDANFLLVQMLDADEKPCNTVAKSVYETMAEEWKVVVRFRGTELNCTGALRITIGTAEENEVMLRRLRDELQKARSK